MDSLVTPKMTHGRRSQLNCKPPPRPTEKEVGQAADSNQTTSEKLASHRQSAFKGHMSQLNGQSKLIRGSTMDHNKKMRHSNVTQSLVGTSTFERPSVNLGGCQVNSRSVRKYGSVKAILIENERMSKTGITIIHPYSTFRLIWDSMTLVLLLVNMLCIPVFMAFPVFEFDNPYAKQANKETYQWVAFTVKILSDSFFAIDTVLRKVERAFGKQSVDKAFRWLTSMGICTPIVSPIIAFELGYYKKVPTTRKWFWLDLISTIPFDVFIGAIANISVDQSAGVQKSTTFLRYFRLTKLFQLLRLLRLTRIFRSKHQWEEMMSIPYDDALVMFRMLTVLMSLLCYAHISACMQFMIPMITGFDHDTWVVIRGLEDANFSTQYGWSFFRAVSQMLCIGYGLSPPNSMLDMYVVTVLMLIGAIGFALYIGYTTSILQSHNASKRLYSEKYSSIKQYMLFRKLPMELRRRISDYYENRYQGKMFNEKQILKELNPILREELINHNCRELVDAVPFFTEADPEFVSTVVTHLKFEVYLYGDEIIRQGTIGRKMYFISRGTVRIVNNRERDISKSHTLSDGEFFGEISIVLPTKRRVCSVFADSYCYLYSLSVEDFNEVLEEFPMQRKHFMAEAAKRLENMREDDSESIGGHVSQMSIRKWYKKRTTVMNGNKTGKNKMGKHSTMSRKSGQVR